MHGRSYECLNAGENSRGGHQGYDEGSRGNRKVTGDLFRVPSRDARHPNFAREDSKTFGSLKEIVYHHKKTQGGKNAKIQRNSS